MQVSTRNQARPGEHRLQGGVKRAVLAFLLVILGLAAQAADDPDRIQPYAANPFYWQYKGQPVLLLGGSNSDALFNKVTELQPGNTTLEEHLDLLVSVGGNCVRSTMSWRKSGDAWPYLRNADGLFDLNQPNPEYWTRFENFLNMTAACGIIVQVELWDQWNFQRNEEHQGGWDRSPFNPANNVNYTAAQSNLPTNSMDVPNQNAHYIFFASVPALRNNTVVLPYQQAFVDKMLSYSLSHRHVLYSIGNECNNPGDHGSNYGKDKAHAWADYWIGYTRGKAAAAGKQIETTDMVNRWFWNNPLPNLGWQMDRPQQYGFLDVSQITSNTRHTSAERDMDFNQLQDARRKALLQIRQTLKNSPLIRPMNNVKIYGNSTEGVQRFWRNLMAGCASVRFHRPTMGLGLNSTAQANIQSARMLEEAINIFAIGMEPSDDLLTGRESNEAHLLAEPGGQYALYFPGDIGDGQVTLDLSGAAGQWKLRWLNIMESRWGSEHTLQGGKQVQIKKPDAGH